MEHMIDGETVYIEKVDLDAKELKWLNKFMNPKKPYTAHPDFDADQNRHVFLALWQHNTGLCRTCNAREGHCLNSTCIRTRITNKLHLSVWETV